VSFYECVWQFSVQKYAQNSTNRPDIDGQLKVSQGHRMATMRSESCIAHYYEGLNHNTSITFVFQVSVTVVGFIEAFSFEI
jgi:hypothetical protein